MVTLGAASQARGDAAPESAKPVMQGKSKKSAKVTKQSKPNSKAGQSASKRAKQRTRSRLVSQAIEAKHYYDGMPPGFHWPRTHTMMEVNARCEQRLNELGVQWEHASDQGEIADPVTITDHMLGGIRYTNTFGPKASSTMDCQLALALAIIAPELRELGVREVKYGSIYDWSYIRARGSRTLSRHAIGTAIDISSFVDGDGREVAVKGSYNQGDPLLHAIEEMFIASEHFHNVISPKNDPVGHYHHFHVEAAADFRGDQLD